MRPAVEAEKLGIPSVVITQTGFTTLAALLSKASGVEGIRLAEYPGPMGIDDPKSMADKLENIVFERIVDGLTRNASVPRSGALAPKTKFNTREIVFTGTLDEVNDYFAAQEWSDGLAIIPPTLERVDKFLAIHGPFAGRKHRNPAGRQPQRDADKHRCERDYGGLPA